ncbi:hypothetical protein [Rossellomorea vietnamensis]|uniref:hypothetical protein n=1 Tax=Rossellomorea vietnamensis TaxID=218284 RepID=UPI000A550164|nr:hypothetical protein [Rossellomorea vietnamensis]
MEDCVQALEEGAKTKIPVAVACGAVGFAVFVFVLFWNYQGKGKPMNKEINIPN